MRTGKRPVGQASWPVHLAAALWGSQSWLRAGFQPALLGDRPRLQNYRSVAALRAYKTRAHEAPTLPDSQRAAILVYHLPHQLREGYAVAPPEHAPSLGGIAHQKVDLGRTEELRIGREIGRAHV